MVTLKMQEYQPPTANNVVPTRITEYSIWSLASSNQSIDNPNLVVVCPEATLMVGLEFGRGGREHSNRSENGLGRGEIFEMLSNKRRRYVLHYLKQRDTADRVPVRAVVDHVTSWETGVPIEQLSSNDRKSVYTSLKQTHLPRLADLGVIVYEEDRGFVTLTDEADELQLYLEYVPADDISWSQFYLGLSAVSAFLAGAVFFEAPLIGAIGWSTVAVIIVALFAVSSLVHTYHIHAHRIGAPEMIENSDIER